MQKKSWVFCLLAFLLASCLAKPDFPDTPTISFKSLALLPILNPTLKGKGDSLSLVIAFQDGDGNLGNNDSTQNFFVRAFKKEQNNFVPVVYSQGQNFNNIFPVLDIVGGSPLEGDLRYGVQFPYLGFPSTPSLKVGDIVKFSIQIQDRAGNRSNTVETNEVILGKYD